MSSSTIGTSLRSLVAIRADQLCEYCLIHEDDTFFGCEIDHIISLKHGGPTDEDNLAFACLFCNRHKGTDVGSILAGTGAFIRFFNPRKDKWSHHFRLEGSFIKPVTDIGTVTASILGFNTSERILEREALIALGRYPTESAKLRIHL
jgi:hypothetical protein